MGMYMERQGAEVIGYDLSDDYAWDTVPYARLDYPALRVAHRDIIRKLNNGYWLAHRAHQSRMRVVYGSVYNIPPEIGPVDIATFGMVLLHVQNPFDALQNALRLTRQTVVITELIPNWLQRINKPWRLYLMRRLVPDWPVIPHTLSRLFWRGVAFEPDFRTRKDPATWWTISPQTLREWLGVLGFEETQLTFHFQRYQSTSVLVYTMVGQRTAPQTW
ncbi:MAG: class I SAM-dependent methyltransferase [Chloroflexaceae bacterium]|nr:class I SAM-dependent methyltransferase [Chloroflexaceae bacterium]